MFKGFAPPWKILDEIRELEKVLADAKEGKEEALVRVERIAFASHGLKHLKDGMAKLEPCRGIFGVDRGLEDLRQARYTLERDKSQFMDSTRFYIAEKEKEREE